MFSQDMSSSSTELNVIGLFLLRKTCWHYFAILFSSTNWKQLNRVPSTSRLLSLHGFYSVALMSFYRMQQTSLNLVNAFLRIRKRIWANRNEEWIITLCDISIRNNNQFSPVPSFSWRHVIELRAQNYQFHHFCPVKKYKWFNLINHTY